jgi:3-deoxy-manno-octulosonate cytidylyltransferase (CMP-KDO synthetase)
MRILCVIPSRIGSTRTLRKALLPIQNKPMIQWVYENAARCPILQEVVVATDSNEIAEVVQKVGGKAIMTNPELPTGSDRVAAVAAQYPDMDVIINLQGDEPFIKPRMLEQLVAPYLAGESPDMTTLASPLDMDTHYTHPGAVKVVTDLQGNALFFSRAPIPFFRTSEKAPVYHHMGLYAFRRDFLLHYTQLAPTPLEKTEALEQMRALEHGFKIRVCITEERTLEINTPEEYQQAQTFIYEE